MKKRSKIPQIRQHTRDKAVIEHLATGPLKPVMGPKGCHRLSESDGRTLEKAIHKQWTPDKGGLQEF
jgi:hypothetical protein